MLITIHGTIVANTGRKNVCCSNIFTILFWYRPGRPNWENTTWIFQDFSVTQILSEVNFGLFEATKTAFLTT